MLKELSLQKHDEKKYLIENPSIDFLYVATKQKDNAFTGCFNYLTQPDKEIGLKFCLSMKNGIVNQDIQIICSERC